MDLLERLCLVRQAYAGSRSYYDKEKGLHLYHIAPSFSQNDLQTLQDCGYPPNQMYRPEHDPILKELKSLTDEWKLAEASDAFIASLWSAPFIWRSALTGKLISAVMPEHPFTPYTGSTTVCTICGFHSDAVDISLSWYQSMISGIQLDGEPVGHVLALREMKKLGKRPVPNYFDRWTFQAILTVIRNLPPKTRYSKAREALQKEKLIPTSSKWVYGSLLEALALIGILDTEDHPGMATAFTTYVERDLRPTVKIEVQAPLAWWNSSIGINEKVLATVFKNFDTSSVSLTKRPNPVPPLSETLTGALENKRVPRAQTPKTPESAGKGPVQAGDVYAIRVREGLWVTAYCHEVGSGAPVRARMEYLDGVYENMPTENELKLSYRGRKNGRWQHWTASIDSTSWVRRVARNIPAPASKEPEPDRIPYGGGKELIYLADWCFSEI